METELTPWQDINPTNRRTDWAEPGERRWLSSNAYVLAAATEQIVTELTQSLAMVAPVGMTQDDREQWLGAAALAIRGAEISPSDFVWAAGKARLDPDCDHHAKIVPAIMRLLGDAKPKVVTVENDERPAPDPEIIARNDALRRIGDRTITQAEIDALPMPTKVFAHTICLLNGDYEGRYWIPGNRPVPA